MDWDQYSFELSLKCGLHFGEIGSLVDVGSIGNYRQIKKTEFSSDQSYADYGLYLIQKEDIKNENLLKMYSFIMLELPMNVRTKMFRSSIFKSIHKRRKCTDLIAYLKENYEDLFLDNPNNHMIKNDVFDLDDIFDMDQVDSEITIGLAKSIKELRLMTHSERICVDREFNIDLNKEEIDRTKAPVHSITGEIFSTREVYPSLNTNSPVGSISEDSIPTPKILTSHLTENKLLNLNTPRKYKYNGENQPLVRDNVQANLGVKNKTIDLRQRRRKEWTRREIECVMEGYKMYQNEWGKWNLIKNHYSHDLADRSNVDIKDCYQRYKKL